MYQCHYHKTFIYGDDWFGTSRDPVRVIFTIRMPGSKFVMIDWNVDDTEMIIRYTDVIYRLLYIIRTKFIFFQKVQFLCILLMVFIYN